MSDESRKDSPVTKAAHTASALKGAVKTGKAIANLSKGAAAGPYGMAAAGLWEGRHLLAKVIVALITLLLLPVMFVLMLPSLIFGNKGLDDVPENVLNDNSILMENIAQTEQSIEAILREKHNALIEKIGAEASRLGSDCEYSITDDFADRIIYESALIISQFCASQEDYLEINLSKLERLLKMGLTTFSATQWMLPAGKNPMKNRENPTPFITMNILWSTPGTIIFQNMYLNLQRNRQKQLAFMPPTYTCFYLTPPTTWKSILT